MAAGDFLGQAVKYPFVIDPTLGRPQLVREKELLEQAMTVLLDTPIGANFVNPDWGSEVRTLIFEPNDVIVEELLFLFIAEALDTWEPRVRFVNCEFEDNDDQSVKNCIITYEINATNELETFVFPFYRELEY